MKFIHPTLKNEILNDAESICEWIIESPELFSKYLYELYQQSNGGEGNFLLLQADKELDFQKNIEVILEPLSINLNDKKILTKLYNELSKLVYEEECYLYTQEVLSVLQKYFANIEEHSTYMLTADEEFDINAIFKVLNIKLEVYSDHYFDKLLQYVKVMAELMKKRLIILVNIRSYLSDEQVMELIKICKYNEIALVLIENIQKSCSLASKHYIIIDKDGCEI